MAYIVTISGDVIFGCINRNIASYQVLTVLLLFIEHEKSYYTKYNH